MIKINSVAVVVVGFLALLIFTSIQTATSDSSVNPCVLRRGNTTSTDCIYLPTVSNLQVSESDMPDFSTSYYIQDVSDSGMIALGCTLAQDAWFNGEPLVFSALQFGQPLVEAGVYGVGIYPVGMNDVEFASLQEVEDATFELVDSFSDCRDLFGSPPIILAIGVNNDGSAVTEEHGRRWGAMVRSLEMRVQDTTGISGVSITVGADLELGFNTASATQGWVDGVLENPVNLYSYGAIGGCPSTPVGGTFNGDCSTGAYSWVQSQVWGITGGREGIFVIPQIYSNDGRNAKQWYHLADYGFRTEQARQLAIIGSLTQEEACNQRPDDELCEYLNNSPANGWIQLETEMNVNSTLPTTFNLDFSSDIRWQTE